jgi:hypothetical protein
MVPPGGTTEEFVEAASVVHLFSPRGTSGRERRS